MNRARWLVGVLVLGSVLGWADPAAAQCVGSTCYRYYADISVQVTASPSSPLLPSSTHTYTISVTNTGWVGFLNNPPVPGASIPSGHVFVGILPNSPDEHPVAHRYISGVPFTCAGYHRGLACDGWSIPTNSTSQFAVDFQAPSLPGFYTCDINVGGDGKNWWDYNEYDNDVTIDYQVDVPPILRPVAKG